MNSLILSTIEREFPGLITNRLGKDCSILGFASVDSYSKGQLIFIDGGSDPAALLSNPPTAVVTTAEYAGKLSANKGIGILVSNDVRLSQALIRQRYDDHNLHDHEWPRIHPTAVIHESVTIPDSATVGPGAVIGRDTIIGQRVVVQANVVIETNCSIGDDSVIHSQVFVGQNCKIGKHVVIKPGCVIGAEGFGFAPDEEKHYHRIPQKGIVVIEDDVVVGSNCNIDRATYGETRIARGTKFDALCHVAHNVFFDEDCIVVAQTGIAGSSRIGKRVIISGQTAVSDHKTVVDDVVMVHRCGVTEDILEPGMYAATPARPFKEYMRNIATFHQLYQLRQNLNSLTRQVKKLVTSSG